jgi:hypothetical protein
MMHFIEGMDSHLVRCMLAKFAEYANVGGNKIGGFGVSRLMPKS